MAVNRLQWALPAGVSALFCDRVGGHSQGPYASFNLGDHVGDCPTAVAANRAALHQRLPAGTRIQWLQQVHGTSVVHVSANAQARTQTQAQARSQSHADAGAASLIQAQGPAQLAAGASDAQPPRADAVFTRSPGIACAVLTADCLPLLLCSADGNAVAAVHAGWRGLVAGVVEQAVGAFATGGESLLAWLGPAIGPQAFEVGPEVRAAFADAASHGQSAATLACFRPSAARPGHYLADLQQLALLRLAALGVHQVVRDTRCTFSNPAQFFSYRRDGSTGRMAALILINPA
jgi:YfiH family protein